MKTWSLMAMACVLGCAGCGRHVLRARTPERPELAGDVAYGYIVFKERPSKDVERDLKVCRELFVGVDHDPDNDAPAGEVRSSTYWPLTSKEGVQLRPAGCPEILDRYDQSFADRIVAALPKSRNWEVFLMAQSGVPFGESSPRMRRVCVDLTRTTEDAGLQEGLRKWRALMTAPPEKWGSTGFADYLHSLLTFFMPKGNVHVDCE